MYSYAISFSDQEVTTQICQEAMTHSEIHKIEYSAGGDDFDVFRRSVKALFSMQQAGILEVASIHIPFGPFSFWSFASPDETARREGIKHIRDFLSLCSVLNCRNFTIHGSGEPIASEVRQQAMTSLRRSILELSEDMIQSGASLNLELLPRSCLGNTPEELLLILKDLPSAIGICCDVNHLCGTPARVPHAITLLSKRLRTFHLSDYDGVDECHWFPGLGVLDWPAIMQKIRGLPQELLLIFEIARLQAPGWQKRNISPEIHCRNCAAAAEMLEKNFAFLS